MHVWCQKSHVFLRVPIMGSMEFLEFRSRVPELGSIGRNQLFNRETWIHAGSDSQWLCVLYAAWDMRSLMVRCRLATSSSL